MATVTKVTAIVNGIEVVLTKDEETGDFVGEIPKSLSGLYAIELYPEDENGNVGFSSLIKREVSEGKIINDQESMSEEVKKKGGIVHASSIKRSLSD